MNKKRACIIAKYLYPGCTRLEQQVRTLAENGIQVSVLCLRGMTQAKVEKSDFIEVYRILDLKDRGDFIKYLIRTLKFAMAAILKLQLLSFKKSFSVIIIHTLPEALVFIGILQKLAGRFLVLDIRDLSVELFASKWGKSRIAFLWPLFKYSEKVSCKIADKIITASPGFKERLISRGVVLNKITLVFNSADLTIFQFQKNRLFKKIENQATLFYHGTIAERFGIDVAIEALFLLLNKIPDSNLHVYGYYDPEYLKKIQRLIAQLKLTDNVFLHKPQSLKNIYQIIKTADIGLVPYRSDDFMNLALSTKMFEYAAAGLPIIASRLRPSENVFNDKCITYFKPGNPIDLEKKISELCLDPKRRKIQVRYAREAHLRVSGEVMSWRYLKLIQEIIKGE